MRRHTNAAALRVAGTAFVVAVAAVVMAPPSAATGAASCSAKDVPTPIAGAADAFVHITVCVPAVARGPLQILLPGATYDSTYWDFPVDPERYSYRRAANAAGFATLTLDALGTGASAEPPSLEISGDAQALAVHDVVSYVRSGIGSYRPGRIVLVGHSEGSMVAVLEASRFGDVDGLVLTGFSHEVNPVQSALGSASFIPATADPQLGVRYRDPGYLTTRPGSRQAAFYAPASPEPAVVDADEATKSVMPAAMTAQALLTIVTPLTRDLRVPVLGVIGRRDSVFCGNSGDCVDDDIFRAREAGFYGPAADYRTYVLPDAGHILNLMSGNAAYRDAVFAWAGRIR
ncbi:alpha/beta hydrolase [Nocardia sp. BSTN01]|uniref:alpha/beta fold hydrolase n=1 Tax=Nocardia sp. BSTN01 TaxID=2783665 RepID=UPI0018906E95|nr:alpha/beta hydrolase [Nocardia sp. BSTN01]MBF4997275.1 alpha/beta hydrolase [Nocardia sp. BSTN01]